MLDLNKQIYNIDGTVTVSKIKQKVNETADDGSVVEVEKLVDRVSTLGVFLVHCVLKTTDTDTNTVMEKYRLFQKLNVPEVDGKKEVELNNGDRSLLKKLVCEHLETFYAGQIVDIINEDKENNK